MFSLHAFSADWFMHQVVSAIIHSAIYGMAFHLFKHLSTVQAVLAGVAMLFVAWVIFKMFSRD